jgi:hypothetical protein
MINSPFDDGLISNRNGPRRSKRNTRNTKVAINKENSIELKLKRFSQTGEGWVEITMPIITVSEANGGAKKAYKRNGKTCYKSEHWTDKHRRHKLQKGTVALLLRPIRHGLRMPCHITLTRYAPTKLDKFDNLPMSMKYILDAICEIITNDFVPGRADSHEGLMVSYDQVVSDEYGVKVRIQNI